MSEAPKINEFLLKGFRRYSFRLIRKNFHSVSVLRDSLIDLQSIRSDQPLVVYANHQSWWDPLTAHFACQHFFPERRLYAPMDLAALEKYRVLSRLGFFGISLQSTNGAREFLTQTRAILNTPDSSVWITPEGKFCDPRDHSTALQPGLVHLAEAMDSGVLLPLAVEQPFWEERSPEVLLCFGQPVEASVCAESRDREEISAMLTERLRRAQSQLAAASIARAADRFDVISRPGSSGTGYDFFRWLRCALTGKQFVSSHGEKLH